MSITGCDPREKINSIISSTVSHDASKENKAKNKSRTTKQPPKTKGKRKWGDSPKGWPACLAHTGSRLHSRHLTAFLAQEKASIPVNPAEPGSPPNTKQNRLEKKEQRDVK